MSTDTLLGWRPPKPQVELIWRDNSEIHRKFLDWRRPCTNQALAEYIEDYLELVREGYQPEGFESPPLPHCARVHHAGKVLAEWHSSAKRQEGSLVGACPPLAQAGMSEAPPLTTSSENRQSGRPSGIKSDRIPQSQCAVNNAPSPGSRVELKSVCSVSRIPTSSKQARTGAFKTQAD